MADFNYQNCSIEELWKHVGVELAKHDVDVVLVGGAVASIYTEGAYQSGDLDFVLNDFSRKKLEKVLSNLGFRRQNRHYVHPECRHLYLEFSSFPVSIGDDTSIEPSEVQVGDVVIKIYTPTDSVRDRLASYMHFNAKECLDQAVMIAQRHPIDYGSVRIWCGKEGKSKTYDEFVARVNSVSKP